MLNTKRNTTNGIAQNAENINNEQKGAFKQMAFKIISADERAKQPRSIKGAIFGPHGIGKTSLLWTVDPATTLFLNLEAGDLALQGWSGDTIDIRTWHDARDMACLIGGPDPARRPNQSYSQAHHDYVRNENKDLAAHLGKYSLHFWDSVSVASRLCFQWAGGEPESVSEKTGAKDIRGTYGLIGRELTEWLTHIQHTPDKSVWVVGGLDLKLDAANRPVWTLQIEGAQAGLKLLGIFDEIITMIDIDGYRSFVCQTQNPGPYPAKDRSGRLEMVEKPHLGELIEKIAGPVKPVAERLFYVMPTDEQAPKPDNAEPAQPSAMEGDDIPF